MAVFICVGLELFMRTWTFIVCLTCLFSRQVQSFVPISPSTTSQARPALVSLMGAAGMGKGMGTVTSRATKGKKKNKTVKKKAAPFDVSASLLRLEKRYEELALASAKALQASDEDDYFSSPNDLVTTEYIVAARSSKVPAVSDWVPVAQLCVARSQQAAESSEGVRCESIQSAVSQYCREIFHAATLGAPVFRSLARNEIQYSVETMDSFHKFVYEAVVEERKEAEKTGDETMSKSQARKVLGLDESDPDRSIIKRAYRSLSFELHPDRFVGVDRASSEVAAAIERFAQVKLAYETLTSGVRSSSPGEISSVSWYESLGGRARTDFHGPVSLLSLEKARDFMSRSKMEGAVVGVDPEMVQTFVARNQASSFRK